MGNVLQHNQQWIPFFNKKKFQDAHNALSPGTFKACYALHAFKKNQGEKLRIILNINKSESPLLEFGAKEIILILDDKVEGRSRPLWMLGCRDDERSKTGLISIHFVQFLNEDDEREASRPKCKAVHDFDIDLNNFDNALTAFEPGP